MTEAVLGLVMRRISGATASSPIAVFRCHKPGELNAVFASTVRTQELIRQGHEDLIGVYDGSMSSDGVRRELEAALSA